MDVEIDPLLFLGLAGSSSTSNTKLRGSNFTEKEKRTLQKLVEKFPAITLKGPINNELRFKKGEAWTKLTKLYNNQPGVSHRTLLQLKTAWLNSKRIARRSQADSSQGSEGKEIAMNEKQHDLINSILSTESSEFKADIKRIKHETFSDDNDSDQEDQDSSYVINEDQAKIKRVMLNIRHDQVLFNLKRKRESIAIERERNLLKYEKAIHELNVKKMELEMRAHTSKDDGDSEKDNLNCNGAGDSGAADSGAADSGAADNGAADS